MNKRLTTPVISRCLLYAVIATCVIVAGVIIVLYAQNRLYDCNLPVDAGLFGNYGDFIGGVIGTFIALYSAYLLVRTLENQAATNESVIATNDSVITANNASIAASQMEGYLTQLQTFDSKFNSFLTSYLKAIDSYNYTCDGATIYGRNAFEVIVKSFVFNEFKNGNEYHRRNYAAVQEYEDFYAKERTHLSVHLRLLYLVMSVIANSELDEDEKVDYAKLIRGQMSDAEMLIVRYNCCSEYGRKMRDYCNSYNLTKHVPIMHLLEFRTYYNSIHAYVNDNQPNILPELIGGLEAMFIDLRKKASQMLYSDGTVSDTYTTNKRYTIKMTANAGHRLFEFEFTKDKKVNRVGGGYRLRATEKALDVFDEASLIGLFYDFVYEIFVTSNFKLYNPNVEINKVPLQNDGNIYSFKIRATSDKSLALTKIQVNNRDNIIIDV